MGFLTNQTTVVDAILTDEGRRRLAEGTFEVAKFSLSDDEIVYSKAQQSQSTSKFRETPIFEAVSDNVKAIKYQLLSLDGDYTHLTTAQLVTNQGPQKGTPQAGTPNSGYYVVIATEATFDDHYQGASAVAVPDGFLPGYSKRIMAASENNYIKVDHGINDDGSNIGEYSFRDPLPAELSETEFMVKLDYRLGRIITTSGVEIRPNFIDDDFIANYVITTTSYPEFFETLIIEESASPIKGSRGLRLKFPIGVATNINTSSNAIWSDLGRTVTTFFGNGTANARVIDATLEIQGVTTSFNITIPLRFVKNA